MRQREKQLWRKNRKKRRGTVSFRPQSRLHLNTHTKHHVNSDKELKLTIELPERLDFDSNYEETASHFAALREAVHKGIRIKNLDFSRIRYISPSAALVLASEVDQWNQRIGGRLKANLPSWDEDIKRLLCQMGYFELLKLERPEAAWPVKSNTFLQFKRGQSFKHGQENKEDGGQLAKQLRMEIESIVGQTIKKCFLFEGLSEAITNVGQHAYPGVIDYTQKRWWLSASYDADERKLSVTFYDQGEGIPKTLPRFTLLEFIKDFSVSWPDSQKISAAMDVGRTSSRLAERGKGLQNLIEFAKAHRHGSISIYSLRGLYNQVFTNDGNTQTHDKTHRDFENSIGGTLVEWSVNL